MATISSPGIGSGLDVNTIITQLVAIERQPVAALQTKATKIQGQISEYGKIKSAMSTFRDAASKLTNLDTWGQTLGASSNAAAVAVTTSSGAAAGNYAVQVQALAAAQSLASGVFPASSATPGAGTLRIELGSWGANQASFTAKTGATAVDVAIEATDTLAQVRDKINGANAGVSAVIFTDGNGARLLMRSTATGLENAFRISVTDGDGTPTDGAGLSALSYDTTPASRQMSRTQTAANAEATFNGLPVNSASNTLTNIVEGVTIKLTGLTAEAVDIGIVQDSDALKKAVQSFADGYNALSTLIANQTKYDAATKTGGPLQGDSSAVGIQRQMRLLAGASSAASGTFARLADIGLSTGADGQMTVNATKLDNALANPAELKKLMSNADPLDASKVGIARQFRNFGDAFLKFDGPLTTRSEGLRSRLDQNKDQQDRLNERIAQTEKRLRAQYSALDTTLSRLNGLSSYVTQQVAQFNNNNR
jgi:flagellar hook-associated protein 2